MKKYVDLENVRTEHQKIIYKKIEDEGIDPFSLEHFEKNHPHPILFQNGSWFVTQNAFPYEDTSLHILLVHKEFITSIEQISKDAWLDLQESIQFCVTKFNLKSGGFFMRFGDTAKTGSSVTHLHAHIIVSDAKTNERKSLYIKIS